VLLAGCSVGRHHRPEVVVQNVDDMSHRVAVRIERQDDGVLLDEQLALQPDEQTTYGDMLPRPDGSDRQYRAVASLEEGATAEEQFDLGSGFHQLAVDVEASDEVAITRIVH
jgi:hypothetical protein